MPCQCFVRSVILTSIIRHYTVVLDQRHVIPSAEFSSGGTPAATGGLAPQCSPHGDARGWMAGSN